jgi:hypothetical protein
VIRRSSGRLADPRHASWSGQPDALMTLFWCIAGKPRHAVVCA